MLDWLAAHGEAANVLINLGMLLVWVVYLHVFVSSYRRQKRANILIAVGAGTGFDARCLVSNLSQSPIYVRSMLIEVRTPSGAVGASVTEIAEVEHWERPSDIDLWTRQGTLQPGGLRDMGTFGAMLEHVLKAGAAGGPAVALDAVERFELTIICNYGPEDLIVAAEQTFSVDWTNGRSTLRPVGIAPRQIRSRRERARIMGRLEHALNAMDR